MELSNLQIKMAKTTSEYNNSHHKKKVLEKQKHMGIIME
jgi:hypothetical protein